NRPDGPAPEVIEYGSDLDEARGVARAVRDAHAPGRGWSRQAVLVRTNAQAAVIADALGRAGVPHRVRGGPALVDRPEIKAALRRMGTGATPFQTALADLEAEAEGSGAVEDDEDVSLTEADRRAALRALALLGRDYEAIDPGATVPGFVAWLRASARFDDAGSGHDAVDVATFHAAKGLEWDTVHLAGVEQGLVPISLAKTSEALAEERRLFYVAITRAERVLRLTWARSRTTNDRTTRRSPSPFLDEVRAVLAALAAGREPTDSLARVREERARLRAKDGGRRGAASADSLSDEDRAVFEALKAWRLEAARAASVPAYVIFPDKTLEAVAAARPEDEPSLLALPGVGPVKAARYGEKLLALVAEAAGD
ncbi:MAG TPA: 3'-5' exonuclease, partial [Acidimicrobiales bacterium]|nr:3'-5' exonuclease [Acidimicrobiales bacterium]